MLSSGCGSSWSLGLVSAHPGMLRQSLDSIIFQTQTAAQRSIANTQNSIFYINHYRYIYIYMIMTSPQGEGISVLLHSLLLLSFNPGPSLKLRKWC